MTHDPIACIWVATDKPRVLAGRHDDDCAGDSCRGCLACPWAHCRVCGHTHAEGTCPGCLNDLRNNLTEIDTLCERLLTEAIHRGIDSEAMNLLGPVADPERLGHTRASIHVGRIPANWLDHANSTSHPLAVLGTHEMLARDVLDQVTDHPTTTHAAQAYLARHLHQLGSHPDYPIRQLRHDLDKCRHHLEDVLRAGEQIEEGAPCQTCKRPVTITTDDNGHRTYRCQRCQRELTEQQYRLAVADEHRARADRLPINTLAERINVPPPTLRRWANVVRIQKPGQEPIEIPALLRSCGRDSRKLKVYRVAEALRIKNAGGDTRRSGGTVSNDGAE